MKVDGSLRSLLQGVSQQPPRDRLPGQSTAQLNMSADPVTGLTRRPPTDLVGSLGSSTSIRNWYDFEVQNGNKYVASFRDNSLFIHNTNGELQDLTIEPDAAAYLVTSGTFAATTHENEIIVANQLRTVAMDTTTSFYTNKGTGSRPQGIIQILGGAYGRRYSISMDGTEIASMRVADGSAPDESQYITTTYIAEVLAWLLVHPDSDPFPPNFVEDTAGDYFGTGALAGANWTVTRSKDIIHIKRNSGAVFLLSVSDDNGNVNMKSMTETVPDTSDLPRWAPQGYVARVATETDPEEDLFLQFIVESSAGTVAMGAGFGNPGYWQECVAPSITYQFNQATMPHVLEYRPDTDDFLFRRGVWKARQVGTGVSNPDPSFVGNTINDVSTMQNRLVFLAGSNTIMSRTNKQDDFWMGSVSAVVDSDPIDISSNAVQTSKMRYAIPHNRDLVIFAERGQFIIFGRTALTPANAAMVLTTAFEASLVARPAPAGRNVFFSMAYGRFSGIREFYTEGGTDINDTRPITQHIKKYIKGTVTQMSTASNYDILLCSTDEDRTNLYTYQYIWSDTEKVQSAWSKWLFSNEILYTFFDRDVFYLVVQDGSELILYRMPMDVEDSLGMEFPIFLDARFDVLNCNRAFTLPFDWLNDQQLRVVQSTDCPNPGMAAIIDTIVYDDDLNAWVVTLKEDMQGGDIIVGIEYLSQYVPTIPIVKDADGVAVGTGVHRITGFIASIDKTGDINGRSYSKWDQGTVVKFQGRVVGDIDNVVGVPAIYSGKFYLPFRHKNDEAETEYFTDSFYPMTILDIEWIGQYNKRGRRLKTGS